MSDRRMKAAAVIPPLCSQQAEAVWRTTHGWREASESALPTEVRGKAPTLFRSTIQHTAHLSERCMLQQAVSLSARRALRPIKLQPSRSK